MLTGQAGAETWTPTREQPVFMLSRFLRARYGRPLRRVMLDLGRTCPNRDGKFGFGGCIYCDVAGSGTGAAPRQPLAAQWQEGVARVRRLHPEGPAAIAYVQSYSNTYPDLLPLRDALDFLAGFRDAAPIVSVGTRPDCFSEDAADLLACQRERFDAVWVEFGLETADDRVQEVIQRYDTLENFFTACRRAKERGLGVVCHTIAGLPGEREDGLRKQVDAAAEAQVDGIKFHQLMVLRRTKLEVMWKRGELSLLSPEQYVTRVADALELLPAHVVVHRLVAEAPPAEYLAPAGWPRKNAVHAAIEAELRRRSSLQGRHAPGEHVSGGRGA